MAPNFLNGSLLLPVKDQLAAATLSKYRELLRKLKANADAIDNESSSVFLQAKERVKRRLREKKLLNKPDPRGAFHRLQNRLATAHSRLVDLKLEQQQKLQQYYTSTLAATTHRLPDATTEVLSQQEETIGSATLGTDGPLRSLVVAGIGGACKLFLNTAANTTITGSEIIEAALQRPAGQPLITVSNHVAALDDPLITAAIIPSEYLLQPSKLRWTMCATDRCFKQAALVPFFKAAKVLPVERGAGISQFGMKVARDRLQQGDWVHIFPEGTRSKSGTSMLPMRRGVGWLVAQCDQPPLIIPFVHSGMQEVLPSGAKLPRVGRNLNILVGQPIAVDDLLAQARKQQWNDYQLQTAITDRIGESLYALKAELDSTTIDQIKPEQSQSALALNEESLLPLIEDEMDSLQHRWRRRWQQMTYTGQKFAEQFIDSNTTSSSPLTLDRAMSILHSSSSFDSHNNKSVMQSALEYSSLRAQRMKEFILA